MANLNNVTKLNDVSIPAARLAKDVMVTVRITGLPIMRLRWWIASGLLRLAARVAGCNLKFDLEPAPPFPYRDRPPTSE